MPKLALPCRIRHRREKPHLRLQCLKLLGRREGRRTGATYYSYLFDRAIAARVWDKVFAKQPLSREAGEEFKNQVLRYGGGKNPWHMLARLLKEDDIARGDSRAMETIGRWGLGCPTSYELP